MLYDSWQNRFGYGAMLNLEQIFNSTQFRALPTALSKCPKLSAYNGYTDTMEKMLRRLEYDLYYWGHRSWLFDFKILLNTFRSNVFGKKFWSI